MSEEEKQDRYSPIEAEIHAFCEDKKFPLSKNIKGFIRGSLQSLISAEYLINICNTAAGFYNEMSLEWSDKAGKSKASHVFNGPKTGVAGYVMCRKNATTGKHFYVSMINHPTGKSEQIGTCSSVSLAKKRIENYISAILSTFFIIFPATYVRMILNLERGRNVHGLHEVTAS